VVGRDFHEYPVEYTKSFGWTMFDRIDRIYDPSRELGNMGFRCRNGFSEMLANSTPGHAGVSRETRVWPLLKDNPWEIMEDTTPSDHRRAPVARLQPGPRMWTSVAARFAASSKLRNIVLSGLCRAGASCKDGSNQIRPDVRNHGPCPASSQSSF